MRPFKKKGLSGTQANGSVKITSLILNCGILGVLGLSHVQQIGNSMNNAEKRALGYGSVHRSVHAVDVTIGALGSPPWESWLMRKNFERKGCINKANLDKLVYSKTSHSIGTREATSRHVCQ